MNELTDKNRPVLRRIWVFVDFPGDHLSQSSLLSKPFASQSADGMPAYLDGA